MLDVSNRLIIIIGGGNVAARKAAGLAAAGATRIRVIAPGFPGDFAPSVEKCTKRYEPDDLKEADLIFAATDSATINDQIVRDAHAAGIWVNRADGSDTFAGDFVTPALLEEGPVTITVSAGSPALAATIRDGIRQRFDVGWKQMADAMQTLRPMIKANEKDPTRRAEMFRRLATPAAIEILREKGIDGLREWISEP